MTQAPNAPALEKVPQSIRDPLRLLTARLVEALGHSLQSVTVVGSSLTDDFRAGTSDINTVVVLDAHRTDALDALASLGKSLRKQKLSPPLLMTASYIERSRDVFGVEFLDFQLTHATVLGDDPFASLVIAKPDVRVQCERELKATLVRLRQGYIAAAGKTALVRDVLIATAKGLAPLLRAMLWLRDIERPRAMAAVFSKATGQFDVHLEAAAATEKWRYDKPRLTDTDLRAAFESVYDAVDRLAAIVDALEVS